MMVTLKALMIAAVGVSLLGQKPAITPQAARGKVLFFETTKGIPCATCHQMEGKGTDAAPDLKLISALSPKGIVLAVLASRTAYMQEVKTASGSTFPGLLKGEAGGVSTYYDFSGNAPKKVELKKSEIADVKDNAKWTHPPESTGYTPEELADVIAYVRWAGKGQTAAVDPADMKR